SATRTPDLEALVRGMYVRGLSTQDIGALYGETFGESRLSKSTVSRITQQLTQDFETWRRRDLSELSVVYVFLDGQYHATRQGTDEKEGVLSALCAPRRRHAGPAALRCGPAGIVRRVAQFSAGPGRARLARSAAGHHGRSARVGQGRQARVAAR